uniref:TIR domain-containing protein n=1 Tax=Timema cristinae TaxID=61476 RepID=A0A7R9CVN7_TIMCR|nr:unnamed protein product [Timema cristinae]
MLFPIGETRGVDFEADISVASRQDEEEEQHESGLFGGKFQIRRLRLLQNPTRAVCFDRSGSDRTWVMSQLVPHLEQGPGKYRLCLHERDFILGSFISTNIVSSLQNSKFTIVILTNNFVTSQPRCPEQRPAKPHVTTHG